MISDIIYVIIMRIIVVLVKVRLVILTLTVMRVIAILVKMIYYKNASGNDDNSNKSNNDE